MEKLCKKSRKIGFVSEQWKENSANTVLANKVLVSL